MIDFIADPDKVECTEGGAAAAPAALVCEPRLACGHVSPCLPAASALLSVRGLVEGVKDGVLPPVRIEDGEVGEYTNGDFTVLLPLKTKWAA